MTSSVSLTPPQTRYINLQLISIPEEPNASPTSSTTSCVVHTHSNDSNQENTAESATPYISLKHTCPTIQSPLSERVVTENHNSDYTSPTNVGTSNNSALQQSPLSSMIFSPTSNLPNYVLNGEAPHLSIMSPKRKHKEKVDWLTKIRKQKLMSSRSATLTEKIIENCNGSQSPIGSTSSRLQTLRTSEASPRFNVTPRRRKSSGTRDILSQDSPSTSNHQVSHPPKTPTSSRRNSETTILRFFSVRTQQQSDTTKYTSPVAATTEILGDLQPLTMSATSSSTLGSVNRSIAYNTSTHAQGTIIYNE